MENLLTCEDIACSVVFGPGMPLLDCMAVISSKLPMQTVSMRQVEPFASQLYDGMRVLEVALRQGDCDCKASRASLQTFITDYCHMAASIGTNIPCIVLYGPSKPLQAACQNVLAVLLRQTPLPRGRFVVCIGSENHPEHSTLCACVSQLSGMATVVRLAGAVRSTCTKFTELRSECSAMLRLWSTGDPSQRNALLACMNRIDRFMLSSGWRLSRLLQELVCAASASSDLTDEQKHTMVHMCAEVDAAFPTVANNKALPLVLARLFLYDVDVPSHAVTPEVEAAGRK